MRKFLGIMAQCRKTDDMEVFNTFTLGCIEVYEQQTTENIKKTLFNTLNDLGVSDSQIFSIRTDGAANIKGVARSVNNLPESNEDERTHAGDEENKDDNENSDIEGEYEIEEFIALDEEQEAAIDLMLKLENFKRVAIMDASLVDVIGNTMNQI